MYRSLLLLIVASASSAPQSSKESDITYVKIQPITEQLAPAKTPYRESRIENLHLTVPNVGAKRFIRRQLKNRNDDSKEVFINKSLNTQLVNESTKEILVNEKSFNPPLKSVEVFGGTDRKTVEVKPKVNSIKETKVIINAKTLEDDVPEELLGKNLNDKDFKANSFDDEKGIESNLSKRSPDTTPDPDPIEIGLPESRPTETPELPKLEEDSIRKEDDSVRKEDSVKKGEDSVRNEEIQTTTFDNISDTTEASDVTDKNIYLEEIIKETEEYETRTRAPTPRFLSKLSYFSKNEEEALVTNFIDRSSVSGYRRFKSKCRCEKIWNCPKLQITVPRCPNEYYLCCF